jgi:2-amino-4-hydroxy-6-hydroxymethyldihydropteridine diphosphokinase
VHQAYLSLGSNIQPESNLLKALDLLREHGEILKVSNAWESKAVGSDGPNFLNACILFVSPFSHEELKENIIHPIEAKLGRKRSTDKYAPRTIDIDIVIFDNQLMNNKFWKQAFVIVPLAEVYPEYRNSLTTESAIEVATHLHEQVWMKVHPEVLSQFTGSSSKFRI